MQKPHSTHTFYSKHACMGVEGVQQASTRKDASRSSLNKKAAALHGPCMMVAQHHITVDLLQT
ncbi:hypothetical protein BDA96_09G075900 [Sorghum bicolor]|uniref:Uncharacterized protein n=2 Tax=Sorghum bicolor TaxID=4558 RepID=A0A921U426_SORBI|nr:hypothetical protein BDA96_09G075900 [Sorghum bicolor]OQU77588.1 hypothetical protein SORBI_3009G072066 [Sorghum bicolor]